MTKENKFNHLEFYESESKNKKLWGTVRERILTENIISEISLKSGKILDVGCGDGYLLHKISKKPDFDVYALDLTIGRLENARKNVQVLKGVRGEITHLPFKEGSFDLVICSEVLEHVPEYTSAVSQLLRVPKSNGELIVTVPNDQELVEISCPYCKKKHFLSGHINTFKKEEFVKLFKKNDTEIKKIRTFYNIFSYNKATFKLPRFMRLFIDCILSKFFKSEYIITRIKKRN